MEAQVVADVISHNEMCRREGLSLQRGMNFGVAGNHSVLLMSLRTNAPYRDRLEDGGTVLVYEGHDQPKGVGCPNPKVIDQPQWIPSGKLTQNGKFHEAAIRFKLGKSSPERVRVYEKVKKGIWAYSGVFHLVDSWTERDEFRIVFKFQLVAVQDDEDFAKPVRTEIERRRIIPTAVKLEVWKRDGGKCQLCQSIDELHFDHIVPFAKGGTSITAANVQLLCARHNLSKSDHIQ